MEQEDNDMAIQDVFHSITERLQGAANVKTIYGDPIESGDKKIVPVAKVAFGFGAGAGSRGGAATEASKSGEGGGGGGGCYVKPVGVIEITGTSTRFVSFNQAPKIAAGVAAGLALGYLMGKCRRRRGA